MDYFMRCPDRSPDPPESPPSNLRIEALLEEKEILEERIFRINCELEDLGWTN